MQLEGPQKFVEKYLDPVIKNCKPFSKSFPRPEPTAEEQDKIRQLEKSTAKDQGFLSIGLFTAALWIYSVPGGGWIGLTVIGALFALSSLYFIFINKLINKGKRQKIINTASILRINIFYLAWSLGLLLLGRYLIQTIPSGWAMIIGRICMFAGGLVLCYGIGISIGRLIKELRIRKHKTEPQNVNRRVINGQ